MKFSIVIPLFNEGLNIVKLVNEINTQLLSSYQYEIVLVNDGSTDNTLEIIKEINLKHPKIIKVINNETNMGQSYSLINGINKSLHDIIVTIDGDGQNNPRDIPKLINIYSSDDKLFLVGGIRINRKDSIIKIYSSLIANKIRNLVLKDNCKDTGCSLKVFDKKLFLSFPTFKGMHRFLPALFKGYEKKTYFVEVDHRQRFYGNSNYGTFERLISGIIDIVRVLMIIKKYKKHND